MSAAPDGTYRLGTDTMGRDLFTRIVFGYRLSLIMAVVVLAIATPIGVVVGLVAGYRGGWTDYVLMRITDVFLAAAAKLAMVIMASSTCSPWPLAITATKSACAARLQRPRRRRGGLCARRRDRRRIDGAYPLPRDPAELLAVDPDQDDPDIGFVILMASSLSFLGPAAADARSRLGWSQRARNTCPMPGGCRSGRRSRSSSWCSASILSVMASAKPSRRNREHGRTRPQ